MSHRDPDRDCTCIAFLTHTKKHVIVLAIHPVKPKTFDHKKALKQLKYMKTIPKIFKYKVSNFILVKNKI